MGSSSSKKYQKTQEINTPPLLVSFIKINEFNKYFKYQKDKGELTKLFYTLIESNFLDGLDLEFKKIKEKKMKEKNDINIKKLLLFILDTLHEELNENANNENNEQNINNNGDEDESKLYQDFINYYYKNNKSPIQTLFYGEEERISKCSICKKESYKFDVLKMLYFDIHAYKANKGKIDIRDLISSYEKPNEKIKTFCNKCKKKTENQSHTIIKKLPEIIIISFDNDKDKIIDYFLNFDIKDEPYLLICFINETKNNVFYLENYKWYEYNIEDKNQKEIERITKITKNPIVAFYQKKIIHDKILMAKYYNRLYLFFNNIRDITVLLKNNISDENQFSDYYIINKKWFNKLTKIFESDELYENDNQIFDSFNQVTNIPNLNINQLKEKTNVVINRVKILEDPDLFTPEFENDPESGIKYPKDFILIKENDLNDLFKDFNLTIKDINNNLYKVQIGENYLFMKDNSNIENNIYYICYPLIFLFNVDKILKYKEDKFYSREIKLYIKNKGGLDYYFEQRNLDVSNNSIQKIIDKENEYIGDLINIVNNKTLYDINKFYKNKKQ